MNRIEQMKTVQMCPWDTSTPSTRVVFKEK